MQLRSVFLLFFITCSVIAGAQPFFSDRQKSIAVVKDTLSLDTLSIIPGSVSIMAGNLLLRDSLDYSVDYANAKLFLKAKTNADSIKVTYRVFPVLLTASRSHKSQEFTGKAEGRRSVCDGRTQQKRKFIKRNFIRE
jgi:hypothetical protein